MLNKIFNMVIVGTGGQGVITLLQVLSEAAKLEGYDLKTSELHGLSQRGGSVEVHLRFGKEIFSPLVSQAKADLILALETQEALRAIPYAGSQTVFLVNRANIPIPLQKAISEEVVLENLKKVSQKIEVISATDICQKALGKPVVAGIFLLGLAVFKNLIPLAPGFLKRAIEKIIPEKYLDINKKAFNLARQH